MRGYREILKSRLGRRRRVNLRFAAFEPDTPITRIRPCYHIFPGVSIGECVERLRLDQQFCFGIMPSGNLSE